MRESRRQPVRRELVAAVLTVLVSALFIAVALGRVRQDNELESRAEAREQRLLREVWGLKPRSARGDAQPVRHGETHNVQVSSPRVVPRNAAHKKVSTPRRMPAAARQPHKVHFGTAEQERMDTTLTRLKEQAKKLGVSFKGNGKTKLRHREMKKLTQLDDDYVDMPIPDLEYGSYTPDIPFPAGTPGAENRAEMQTLAENSGPSDVKLEDAGMIYPTVQFASAPKDTTLYAPAWSPDYLEPARHAPTDHEAWEWIAKAKKEEEMYEKEEMAKVKEGTTSKRNAEHVSELKSSSNAKGKSPATNADRAHHNFGSAWELPMGPETAARKQREEAMRQAWGLDKPHIVHQALAQAKTMSLAELSPKQEHSELKGEDGCPWYGCADGSDSWRDRKRQEKLKAAQHILKQEEKQSASSGLKSTGLNAKTEKLLGFPSIESPTQKLLSHGYGTTNAFKADPITAPHDEFYGGDHRFYGSDLPVFGRGEGSYEARSTKSHVKAHEAYGVDGKTAVYDLDEPHSFDSVPLASPSSFLSRVEAHYPNGYDTAHPLSPGKLQAKLFRGQVLADWRKYEHGLTQCLEAEATIDPNLQDTSCQDVSTGLSYLQSCMQNHKFGLDTVTEAAVAGPPAPQLASVWAEVKHGDHTGAWGALPKLVQMTYQLEAEDYKTVYQVLSNSAVFDTLWKMEKLHARCAATGSAVKYRPRGDRVRQIDSEVHYLDKLLKWWNPGTPEMQKGEAIIQGAYRGLPWEHASQARAGARNYMTYSNSRKPDASAYPNLPFANQYYGPETGYYAQDWQPEEKEARDGLPRWRVPAEGDNSIKNPSGNVGTLGDYTMQQPRAKLVKDKKSHRFPVTVNGNFVDPSNPRPWQADKGAYNPWTGYFWTGPGKYDAVAEAHPMTQYTTGYNYPTTVKPEIVQACEEDTNCPASEVCSTGGYCRKWENGERWYVPANGGIWRADSGVAESWV